MTTNLLAAIVVALSTNTVEKVTAYAREVRASCADVGHTLPEHFGCTALHYKGVDPIEKIITITAKRTTTLTFDWMGKTQSVEHVDVLWESNKVVRLEWREVPQVGGGNLLNGGYFAYTAINVPSQTYTLTWPDYVIDSNGKTNWLIAK